MDEPKDDDAPFPRLHRATHFLRRWGGAIALAGICTWITGEAISWSREAHGVREGAHLRDLGEKLLVKELDALHREEIEDALPDRLADHYWEQHLRMVAGTPRESPARALREESRRHRSERRAKIVRACATRAGGALHDGRPLAAAWEILLLPAGARSSPESQELLVRVEEEILRATGMNLVQRPTAGNSALPNVQRGPSVPEVRAYLLSERPLSTSFLDDAASEQPPRDTAALEPLAWKALIEKTRRDALDDGPGMTGTTFLEAHEIAARLGLRLPHNDEIETARAQRQVGAVAPAASGGIRERQPVEWEWALVGAETRTTTSPLALCVRTRPQAAAPVPPPGGAGAGAPGPQGEPAIEAQRRHADRGYPDVGFRLAIDLEEAVRREREALQR